MLKFFAAIPTACLLAVPANAGCIGAVISGNCAGATIDSPFVGTATNENSGYQGSSGSSYQYDLSNPSDRNSYSTDLSAQMRDARSLDLGRTQDRGLGQFGGGILNN
ncbi:hypothetical protein [Paracoccus sp. R86501]|uniref:hypothetical protein n=1 Tax=Paracoccus sp. R86501 TaxID=3101711 RepID=UPI00366F6975